MAKQEQAKKDYLSGMKYKDTDSKSKVSSNNIRYYIYVYKKATILFCGSFNYFCT